MLRMSPLSPVPLLQCHIDALFFLPSSSRSATRSIWAGWDALCPPFLFSSLLSTSLASSLSVVHSGPLPSYPVPAVPNTRLLASISCQTANCLDRSIILDGDNINEGLVCTILHLSACPCGRADLRAVRVFSSARRCRTSPSRHYSSYAPYPIPSHLTPGPRLRMNMSLRHERSRPR
ncbi:hypothetical protein B0H14DRAFT_2743631 [Mycena olivaceomarginata]|nr:hypothetical protein B0H14DRAFT_2743631 [Mycena olivaceomarginata]